MKILPPILCALATSVSVFAAADSRPNILFIVTDDQGPWTTGYSGNQDAHTPYMDRLRSEGANLVNSFVTTPVCSPSRTTLMTGRYASEFGILDWINPRAEPEHGLDPRAIVWPRLLQSAGYKTGLVGKWHLGKTPRHHPTRFGYGYFMGILTGGTTPKNPVLEKDGKEQKMEGLTVDILTDHALKFIRGNSGNRWALSLHYRAPHAAYLPVADEVWDRFKNLDVTLTDYPDLDVTMMTRVMREYLASIADVDRNVGRLLNLLDETGLAQNTLVVFTSDHGYNVGHHGLQYKGNAFWRLQTTPAQQWEKIPANRRPNMFDTSLRVPTIIRWPGIVRPGRTITETVCNLDWFPTLCDIANVKIPKSVHLRGRSIQPLLQETAKNWNNDFYGEYSMRHGATTAMRVYRTPDWKLMRDFKNPGRAELYDLKYDPGETKNLIHSDSPAVKRVIADLDKKLRAKMREVNDRELKPVK